MKKVLSFVKEHHMIENGDHVLAAVSGGADSVCLLLLLLKLREVFSMEVSVIHVEHGIRGAASRADAAFVKALCEREKVPCRVYECDAVSYARERGMGLEEGARALRYEYFESCLKEQKADKIAVAHNQNDCAETVLFHLARGAGLRGLAGIRPVRGNVIRPLLCLSRQEIEAFLQEQGQDYCIDATNQELCYSRNKMRSQVLPVLSEINSGAVGHIARTAELMAQVDALLRLQTAQAWQRWVKAKGPGGGKQTKVLKEPGGSFLLCEEIRKEPLLLQQMLVLELLEVCAGSRKDLNTEHVFLMLELFGHQTGHRVSLPYGMEAYRTYGGVELAQRTPAEKEVWQKERGQPEGSGAGNGCCRTLPLGETVVLPRYGISIFCKIIKKMADLQEIPKKKYTKWFDYDKIKSGLLLRNPGPDDYLIIDAQGRHQSLKKYFVNEKIPAGMRESRLVLADGNHILWVLGYRISEACKVTEDTTQILEIQINGGEAHE